MDEQYPFLELAKKHNTIDLRPGLVDGNARSDPATFSPQKASRDRGEPHDVQSLFEASVTGVQNTFNHLSKDDIAHPPHRWFDAALARQIAFHIMINRFDVPWRRLAKELVRSREAVMRAMRTVNERLLDEDFANSYETMADVADKAIDGKTPDGENS